MTEKQDNLAGEEWIDTTIDERYDYNGFLIQEGYNWEADKEDPCKTLDSYEEDWGL